MEKWTRRLPMPTALLFGSWGIGIGMRSFFWGGEIIEGALAGGATLILSSVFLKKLQERYPKSTRK